MNRELKFRIWDQKDKLFWKSDDGIYFYLDDDLDRRLAVSVSKFIQESDRFAIQQFTGLKDKNGREIYEGDIINTLNYIGPVEFKNGSFFVREVKTLNIGEPRYMGTPYWNEVIGNIFENPEFLT